VKLVDDGTAERSQDELGGGVPALGFGYQLGLPLSHTKLRTRARLAGSLEAVPLVGEDQRVSGCVKQAAAVFVVTGFSLESKRCLDLARFGRPIVKQCARPALLRHKGL